MPTVESSRACDTTKRVVGAVLTVLGRRYVLEFKPGEERAFSFGSAVHADVRVLHPDVAPTQFYFEQFAEGIHIHPGYSMHSVLMDGRPLAGTMPLGKNHHLKIGGIDVTIETFDRRRDVPSESGVSLAPREGQAVGLRNPRADSRLAALRRAREFGDDDAQTHLAVPLGESALLGDRKEARAQARCPGLQGASSAPQATATWRSQDEPFSEAADPGSPQCDDDAPTRLAVAVELRSLFENGAAPSPEAPAWPPPMSETVLESPELGRVREALAARSAAQSATPQRGAPGSCAGSRSAPDDAVCARPKMRSVPLPAQPWHPLQKSSKLIRQLTAWAGLHQTYLAAAGLGIIGGVALVVAFSIGRSVGAPSGDTEGASVGKRSAAGMVSAGLRVAGKPGLREGEPRRARAPESEGTHGSVGNARAVPMTRIQDAAASSALGASVQAPASAGDVAHGAGAAMEVSASDLSAVAIAELLSGRYSEAAVRYAAAAAAQPKSKPHGVLAQLMRRASSQRCSGAQGQTLRFCPEVQR